MLQRLFQCCLFLAQKLLRPDYQMDIKSSIYHFSVVCDINLLEFRL